MSTKSALRADLDAEDRKTLAEDRKRMERLGKGSQLDDWLAFGPGLLIRRRLAKNIAGLAETDPAKGHRYSRAFKEQMEMDGLYDRTTKSDVMKSTCALVLRRRKAGGAAKGNSGRDTPQHDARPACPVLRMLFGVQN